MTGTGNDQQDRDIWLGLGLAEAASGVRTGPVPVADIMAGGRRIRRRRRTVVGALALASAVTLGGGALAQLPRGQAPATAAAGTSTLVAAGSAPSAAATAAVKDPLKPQRVLLAEGVTDGKSWKVWRALWPLAPKERAYEQALALWQERSPYSPNATKPTEAYVAQYWQSGNDLVNDYVEVDGVRQGHDSAGSLPAAGHLDPRSVTDQTTFGAGMLGHWSKDDPGPFFPAEIGTVGLGPVVDKVVITWSDGTKTEPKPVTVGDSPIREIALAQPSGKRATLWEFFARDGRKLPNDGTTLFR
ncbi:hypothetical protein [Kitasatospora sp. NPDC101183]|uniref:hypothetical protein n=1 Tax=Kitasatospora sp. NPDC101183 TaxID=3364100 RepID=UPI0038241F86